MADTLLGNFTDLVCSDCGVSGCEYKHWGPLVPKGARGSFCPACYSVRDLESMQGREPRPLGKFSMLTALELLESKLPKLLNDESDEEGWESVFVNYHPPFVERVFGYWAGFRVSLHKIHPCAPEEALFHPHPWPSAMRILSGQYEMAVGYGAGDTPPPVAAKLVLPAGTTYEMINRDAWHYVRPLDKPAFSLLITGTPWGRSAPKSDKPLQPLPKEKKEEIISFFREKYPV
ncbi:MAG: Uncharacterized protein G01um101419_105 [Parcubacteria group bacterium Gr01-1014_19]|nr:MAG: Uncharacterized protein G01um101419_105 [Parcubacteria group bacterium Gr01-1014_19]